MKLLVITVLILALSINLVKARCLSPDQVEICSNEDLTSCKCETCPVCKPGEGLNIECLGPMKGNVTFKCVPCILGVTYSRFNDTGVCQPCPTCEGHLMLSRCTTKRPTKCSPDQCKAGFVWNPVVDSCEKFPTPKRTSTTPLPVTTPVIRTSTTTRPTTTAPVSKVPTPKLIPMTMQSPRTPKKEDSNDDHTPRPESSQDNYQKHLEDIKNGQKVTITVVVVVVLVVASIATTIYVCKDRRRRLQCQRCCKTVEEGRPEERVQLGDLAEESPELPHKDIQVQVYPWPADYKLREISPEIKQIITVGISNPKMNVWEQVGIDLKVDSINLKNIENHIPPDRGSLLLQYLGTSQPKLTLTRFMDLCAKWKRNDIVEDVKKEYQQSNATFKASIQDVNEGKEDHQEQG